MANTKVITFTTKVNGESKELMVRSPNLEQQREGQKVYNRAFNDAVSSGALLREKLEDFMRKQNMWDDDKQVEMTRLGEEISRKEQSLAKGGIKLSEAKKIALDLRKLRYEVRNLISERTDLDVHTAQGQADNARFNYWVSVCLVYNDTQKPVFSSMEDYLNNSTEVYAVEGAGKLAQLLYNLSDDYESKLEENKFLREFGFTDDKNRLVNQDGHLVDEDGRLIDEFGNLVDEQGRKVDSEGNLLDENNNYIFDKKPFLDDDGNEIVKDKDPEVETAVESVENES